MRKVWTYAPQSGGVKIKPAEQERIRQRILAHANKHYAGKFTRLDIRFRGALVYSPLAAVIIAARRARAFV
jgi:hypothetical protein